MKRQPAKPVYGKSQGAKSSGFNLDKGNYKKSHSLAQKDRNSSEIHNPTAEQRPPQQANRIRRFAKIKPVTIASFPRTILKLGVAGIVIHQVLVSTPIGRSLAARGSQHLANISKNIGETLSKLDPKNTQQKRQENADNSFDDSWRRAGGEIEKKE